MTTYPLSIPTNHPLFCKYFLQYAHFARKYSSREIGDEHIPLVIFSDRVHFIRTSRLNLRRHRAESRGFEAGLGLGASRFRRSSPRPLLALYIPDHFSGESTFTPASINGRDNDIVSTGGEIAQRDIHGAAVIDHDFIVVITMRQAVVNTVAGDL